MAEPIDWLPDGTPYSPRFGDRYRSEAGRSLAQAREVFLAGCGLPAAWAGSPDWCILETGFGLGLNFLVAWQAWRDDPARPARLHYVATEAWPVSADDMRRALPAEAGADAGLETLADQLADRWWGLLPGHHRLEFEGGRVLLTLLVGDSTRLLRETPFTADSVFLDGFSPDVNPDIWDAFAMKAVARHARPGTRAATWTVARSVRDALAEAGFTPKKVLGVPPKRTNLQAVYEPRWTPRGHADALLRTAPAAPATAVVVGAGMAGAAVAHSLARRGWQVTVLEAGPQPAAGASGLPAGLFAPHTSPDDAPLSRLTRAGLRQLRAVAAGLLQEGQDWGPFGLLERCMDGRDGLPADDTGMRADWSRLARPAEQIAAGLPAEAVALWHARAGWLRPARLVAALLATPGITLRTGVRVAGFAAGGPGCRLLDADGAMLAEAALAVVACGAGSPALLPGLAVQPLAGQVSLGTVASPAFPPFPVNGQGSFLSGIPLDGQPHWLAGATFERNSPSAAAPPERVAAAHVENRDKLRGLLPAAAEALDQADASGDALQSWRGVRGTVADRLPLVGPWPLGTNAATPDSPLWLCAGMGARGLTLSLLCGELLAARLHGEPLPLERRLAEALDAARLVPRPPA